MLFPLAVASWLYAGAATLHRCVYERGVVQAAAFPGHVLSVGGVLAAPREMPDPRAEVVGAITDLDAHPTRITPELRAALRTLMPPEGGP